MWTLDAKHGFLSTPSFSAVVPLHQPDAGLQNIQFNGKSVAVNKLLSISVDEPASRDAAVLIDQYVRGNDLVATYDETAQLPVKSQVYWRAFEIGQPTACVGVELILSRQTSLLDSDPGIVISSELTASEIVEMAKTSPAEFVSRAVDPQVSVLDSAASSGLMLIRLSDSELTWIQMVHPKDFVTVDVSAGAQRDTVLICHRLFSERLEKGVIRRGRLRGILVPRADDQQTALDCYRQLRASLPPLTV